MRDVITTGVISLKKIFNVVLDEKMDKSPFVRFCRFSSPQLSKEKLLHTGLDAIKSCRFILK